MHEFLRPPFILGWGKAAKEVRPGRWTADGDITGHPPPPSSAPSHGSALRGDNGGRRRDIRRKSVLRRYSLHPGPGRDGQGREGKGLPVRGRIGRRHRTGRPRLEGPAVRQTMRFRDRCWCDALTGARSGGPGPAGPG